MGLLCLDATRNRKVRESKQGGRANQTNKCEKTNIICMYTKIDINSDYKDTYKFLVWYETVTLFLSHYLCTCRYGQ
jgi:hypothetical protein